MGLIVFAAWVTMVSIVLNFRSLAFIGSLVILGDIYLF